ncbi:hypothetical protein TrLO_g8640 [Triparma laevis f. longispina]|uniref:Uncharacterized protein n=1 Tax=Triparma laevis f. longispina TaxID=1714387 RepID=A0A9W7B1P2_9STRA|nr:hypothetical protein TrLO_g8640 [Triparma laevis f. longispina]
MIFHRGVVIAFDRGNSSEEEKQAFGLAGEEGNKRVTQVLFIQKIPLIGDWACCCAVNLIVVVNINDDPALENVDLLHTNLHELGQEAFGGCGKLKSVTIPDSLQTLGYIVFLEDFKLVLSNIDTFDTNVVVAYLRSQQN